MKIGLLPLYIKLYDDCEWETYHVRLDPFYKTVVQKFEAMGLEVVSSEFCRLKDEFDATVKRFEKEQVDCIVTLHMAYSPSLESVDALVGTDLPIVVLDTTETFDFSDGQDQAEISFCHGIHGVMDMCNLLMRRGKPYAIAAGHYEESDVLERCVGYVKAAVAAKALSGLKVGSVGGSFAGMGDFIVTDEELKDALGAEVVYSDKDELCALAAAVTAEEIAEEVAAYKRDYREIRATSEEAFENTARACLAIRKWIEKHGLGAFTVNFLKIGAESGIYAMPFIEACKQMACGVGYAGEGDVLTASIVGALMHGYADSSFVEIFCPDWKGGRVFISHMGEMNMNLCADRPEMMETPFIYVENTQNPVVAYGCYKSGEAVFVNVYRDENGFCLLCAPVAVEAETTDNFAGNIRGWLRPACSTAEFLEKLSYAGVTHHSALVYGATAEQMAYFARLIGIQTVVTIR